MKYSLQHMILCICFLLLLGCSNDKIISKPLYQKSEEIISLVNQLQWEKAKEEVRVIEDLYQKDEWKFQLLGDESEYDGLNQEISQLKVSIQEEDKMEAKSSLVIIQDYIRAIYFR